MEYCSLLFSALFGMHAADMPQNDTSSFATPVPASLAPWRMTTELVALVGGTQTEVVLHDLSDPLHSVVYVVNGHVTNRKIGQGVRHLVEEILLRGEHPEKGDLLPVWWFRHKDKDGVEKLIRSVTMLIRGVDGRLAGALCVNQDVTADLAELERLDWLLPPEMKAQFGESSLSAGPAKKSAREEGLAAGESVADAVFDLIDRMVDEAKAQAAPSDSPPSRPVRKASWTREDRVKLLAFMESRGIFLMKGALEHAADRLGVSKVTIYSDLDQIRRLAKFGKTPYWRGEE